MIPKGLLIKPRDTDFVLGSNSSISFKSVNPTGDWTPRLEFFENQKLSWGDTNGCVLFTSQESLDAQMDFLISSGAIPQNVLDQLNKMGFMDLGKDGLPHFHSSPRFLQVLTGNGTEGNSIPEAWDVLRKYGTVPYKDLPPDSATEAEYFTIPQGLLDKGKTFLNLLGGKIAFPYHWIANGVPKNLDLMQASIPQAPLCIGIAVGEPWNQVTPADPPVGASPQHCVLIYKISKPNLNTEDHYVPYEKILDAGYDVRYVFQGIVNPIFTLPLPTLPSQATNFQISLWLSAVSAWLQDVINQLKGRKLSSNMSNLFSLNWRDLGKGAVTAVFTAVVLALGTAAQSGNFDVFTFDWASIGKLALSAFVAYLFKNFLSTPDGKVLGKI